MNICVVITSYTATKIIDCIRLHSPPMHRTSYYTACCTNDHFIKYIPYLGVTEKQYLYLAYISVTTCAHVGSMCVCIQKGLGGFLCVLTCACACGGKVGGEREGHGRKRYFLQVYTCIHGCINPSVHTHVGNG